MTTKIIPWGMVYDEKDPKRAGVGLVRTGEPIVLDSSSGLESTRTFYLGERFAPRKVIITDTPEGVSIQSREEIFIWYREQMPQNVTTGKDGKRVSVMSLGSGYGKLWIDWTPSGSPER